MMAYTSTALFSCNVILRVLITFVLLVSDEHLASTTYSAPEEIQFPPVVVFRGPNGAYLKVFDFSWFRERFLQFSGGKHESFSKFEVITKADGYVAIRSIPFNRYWTRSNGNWLTATAENPSGPHALFKPVRFGNNRVAFIHKETNKFCRRLTSSYFRWNLLNAQTDNIDDECYLTVEEPVVSRTITEVVYNENDKQVISIEPVIFHTQIVHNNSSSGNSFVAHYSYTSTKSQSFGKALAFTTGVATTLNAGIPSFVNGKVEISLSTTLSLTWNTVTTTTSTTSGTLTIDSIKPGEKVKLTIRGEKAVCNIPFTYKQVDNMADGTVATYTLLDGTFFGMDQYTTRFVTERIR